MTELSERIFVGLGDARLRGQRDQRELPVVNVRDLKDGRVAPPNGLATRPVRADGDVGRYEVREGDVLLTCRGTQLKMALVPQGYEHTLLSSNLIAIRPGQQLLPDVLFAFIRSSTGHAALLQRGRSSTSSLSLTAKEVGAVLVPLPPVDVQHRIADLIRAAEENHEAAVRAAEQRRAVALAVAHQLFAGTATHTPTTENED